MPNLGLEINHIERIESLKKQTQKLKNRQKKEAKAERKNKLQESTPESRFKDMCEPGYYIIHKNAEILFLKLTKAEDVVTQYQDSSVLSIKKIDKTAYDAWDAVVSTSAKIECSPTEVLAILEGGITHIEKLQLSKTVTAELKKAVKVHAKCSVSLAGIFAEVGVSGSIETTIEGKRIKYNSKLYIQGKVGAFVSPLGAAVFANAEAGAQHTLTAKFKSDNFKFEPFFSIKSYVKAEAKLGIGYNPNSGIYEATEAENEATGEMELKAKAFAGIGITVTIGAKISRKDKDSSKDDDKPTFHPLGSLELAGGIKVGVGVGGDLALTLLVKNEENNGVIYNVVSVGVKGSLGLGPDVGLSLQGTLKVTQEAYAAIKDKLSEAIKHLIKAVVAEEIRKEIGIVLDELESLKRVARDKAKTGLRNAHNYLDKACIGIEKGLGNDHKALKDELRRHIYKLEQYKADAEKMKDRVLKHGDGDELDLDAMVKGIKDQGMMNLLKALESSTAMNYIEMLHKYVKKYERRIEKLNAFLNDEIEQHYEDITRKLDKIRTIINDNLSPEGILEGDKDKIRQKINKKVDSINGLLEDFNIIVNTKQNLSDAGNELTDEELDLDTQSVIDLIQEHNDELEDNISDAIELINNYRDLLA